MSAQLALKFCRYPELPGFKRKGPSERAARRMFTRSKELQLWVLELLSMDSRTVPELCEALQDVKMRSIPPRVSELVAAGHVRDTGRERFNDDGNLVTVWEITESGRLRIDALRELRRLAA